MVQTQPHEPIAHPSDAWAGCITFAAVILTLIGSLNAIQGFMALFDDGYAQIGFLPAYPVWSAIMILLGVLVIFALTAPG